MPKIITQFSFWSVQYVMTQQTFQQIKQRRILWKMVLHLLVPVDIFNS